MEQFHIYQKQILKSLMYKSSLRFNELMIPELSSKHFNYHLKKLIEGGYVTNKNRQYVLTDEGKELVKRKDLFNTFLDKLEFVRNPQKGVQFREIITEAEGY